VRRWANERIRRLLTALMNAATVEQTNTMDGEIFDLDPEDYHL
jgi:hypothetical protein